jgi:hypothetical protein
MHTAHKKELFSQGIVQAHKVPPAIPTIVMIRGDMFQALLAENPKLLWCLFNIMTEARIENVHVEVVEPIRGLAPEVSDVVFTDPAVAEILTDGTDVLRIVRSAMIELSYAYTEKELKRANITSWAKSHRFGPAFQSVVEEVLPVLSCRLVATRDPPPATRWLEYRLVEQSTSTLCQHALNSLGSAAKMIYTNAEAEAIAASSRFDGESGISDEAIAKSAIVLQSMSIEFGTWYQGEKALTKFPAVKSKAIRQVLKEAVTKTYNESDLAAAKSLDEAISVLRLTDEAKIVGSNLHAMRIRSGVAKALIRADKLADPLAGVQIPDATDEEVTASVRDLVTNVASASQ